MDVPTNISTGTSFAQWIKDVSKEDEYASFYFSRVSDPDTDPLPYPFIEFPSNYPQKCVNRTP
eukprot:gene30842-35881_t